MKYFSFHHSQFLAYGLLMAASPLLAQNWNANANTTPVVTGTLAPASSTTKFAISEN